MTNLGISSQSYIDLNLTPTMKKRFCGMDNLSSIMKGIETETDLEIKLKSSLGSRVRVGS